MSGYEYGNTRLRAMKSRLLNEGDFRALSRAESLDGVILTLSKTAYQRSLEQAMVQSSGMDLFRTLIRQQREDVFGRLRRFYQSPQLALVELFLWRYEVHNIKTILRGLAQGSSSDMIRSALIPTGLVPSAVLDSLAAIQDVQQLVGRVVTLDLPYARSLLRAFDRQTAFNLAALEVSLESWFFEQARPLLQKKTAGVENLKKALALEADLTNLLTALRFVGSQQKIGIEALLVPEGEIPDRQLKQIAQSQDLQEVLAVLTRQPFVKALEASLSDYQTYENLADLEKFLRQVRLAWYLRMMRADPLGIGVPLGFLALKNNELRNLAWVTRGVWFRFPPETIRQNLEFAA